MSEEYPYDMNEVLDEMAIAPYKAEIARLQALIREIRDIAMYRNDGTEIINLCDKAVEGKDE